MQKTNPYLLLKKKILSRKARISVIGLGYVGLPLAVAFAKKGYFVYGYDTNKKRINSLYQGRRYITDIKPELPLSLIDKGRFHPSSKEKVLADSDAVIICVPTPLRKVKTPDISYIIQASKTIAKYLHKGQLIILESTTYPGTSRDILLPILEKKEFKEGKDFFLCFSPERVDPGNKKYPLEKISKIVGGISRKSTYLTRLLYSKIINKVVSVSSIETAEIVKLLENTFRLVNIGLINEFALVCRRLGIDVWEVINAAKTKPFGFMPFYPGPGIGGHCIPCDPVYLSWKAKELGFQTKMIDLASFTNRFMPKYVVKQVLGLLISKGIKLSQAKILVIGVTYKKDVKDLRESPALDIIELFKNKKAKTDYYDPLIPYLKIKGIKLKSVSLTKNVLKKYDCAVIVTGHSGVDYDLIRGNSKLIFDTRNVYKRKYGNVVKL